MLNEPPGSKEIRDLIKGLQVQASALRARGETEIAEHFEKSASALVVGPAGEVPLRTFSNYIHHPKGAIDEQPAGFSPSEWRGMVGFLQKLTISALSSNGWSPGLLALLKKALWPF